MKIGSFDENALSGGFFIVCLNNNKVQLWKINSL